MYWNFLLIEQNCPLNMSILINIILKKWLQTQNPILPNDESAMAGLKHCRFLGPAGRFVPYLALDCPAHKWSIWLLEAIDSPKIWLQLIYIHFKLKTSSTAFSDFLSWPFSININASRKYRTISAGDLCDFPNNGILSIYLAKIKKLNK